MFCMFLQLFKFLKNITLGLRPTSEARTPVKIKNAHEAYFNALNMNLRHQNIYF